MKLAILSFFLISINLAQANQFININQVTTTHHQLELADTPVNTVNIKMEPKCPTGYTFDTANCYWKHPQNEAFIWQNGFYTKPNITHELGCPEGSSFDSANCYFGPKNASTVQKMTKHAKYAKDFFEYQGGLYSKRVNIEKKTCEPGSQFDSANCYFGPIPSGYEGFIYQNGFYVKPKMQVVAGKPVVKADDPVRNSLARKINKRAIKKSNFKGSTYVLTGNGQCKKLSKNQPWHESAHFNTLLECRRAVIELKRKR